MTLQTLAETYSRCFEGATRDSGAHFRRLKEGSPEELTDLIRNAHNSCLPDDYKYAFVEEALDALAAVEDPDDAEVEADYRNHALALWLAESYDGFGYCDEAARDFGGKPDSTFALLQWGQQAEKEEVLGLVRQWLETHLETLEEAEESPVPA